MDKEQTKFNAGAEPNRGAADRTVTVVVPTHNNLSLLRQCLTSLQRQDYPANLVDIVVVDNASGDGTFKAVNAPSQGVTCLRLEHNAGFAEACNRGAAEAKGDHIAFINDDAVADPGWLSMLFRGLDAGGEGAVCAASRILSHDGSETEFNGASSNLFGVGRPRSVSGWPDAPKPPSEGSPLLFASGGAMLIHRRTFLDVGGFDPAFFAWFEDVDLGWRLWALGHRVVFAPASTVRHIGGSTGTRQPAYRRYTLWECNSLAIILKNYEDGNMERILSAGLLLLYKRALLAAGDAVQPDSYAFGASRDTNAANVERLPRMSVAHIAAIDRFNHLLPHFMEERRRIQQARVRPDREILPMLGRLWEPQFAGEEYAEASRQLASSLDLYGLTAPSAPNRVLVVSDGPSSAASRLASSLAEQFTVALAVIGHASNVKGADHKSGDEASGYLEHNLAPDDLILVGLLQQADAVVAIDSAARLEALARSSTPAISIAGDHDIDLEAVRRFCAAPQRLDKAVSAHFAVNWG